MTSLEYRAGYRAGVKHMEDATRKMAEQLREALTIIERVREIHDDYLGYCVECTSTYRVTASDEWTTTVIYPCTTIKALDGNNNG